MRIERGVMDALPYASVGSGPPVVVLAGLSPVAGVTSDTLVRGVLTPVRQLANRRRLIVINRRPGLPADLSMGELATEHAHALRTTFNAPVDVMGVSTGGSIAQQLAADHPDVVDRLVVVSAACRLGPVGRQLQREVAVALRAGRTRRAVSIAAAGIAPRPVRAVARGLGWVAAQRVVVGPSAVADLAVTLEAEDSFDLATCERPIMAKTLIVAGEHDRFYGSHLFRETAELIPDSRLLLLPGRGHLSVTRDRRATGNIAGFLTRPVTGAAQQG